MDEGRGGEWPPLQNFQKAHCIFFNLYFYLYGHHQVILFFYITKTPPSHTSHHPLKPHSLVRLKNFARKQIHPNLWLDIYKHTEINLCRLPNASLIPTVLSINRQIGDYGRGDRITPSGPLEIHESIVGPITGMGAPWVLTLEVTFMGYNEMPSTEGGGCPWNCHWWASHVVFLQSL